MVTLPVLSIARKESTSVRASGLAAPCACAPADEPASAKLTMRAPEPSRASRREIWMFMCASLSRRALDGAHDARMGSAAAKVVGKRILDGCFGRLLVLGEESRRLHDHSVDAVAALRGLLVDKGLLHPVRFFRRAKAFQRDNLLVHIDRRKRRDACAARARVDTDDD